MAVTAPEPGEPEDLEQAAAVFTGLRSRLFLEERDQPGQGVTVGDGVGELGGDGRDRDHEGEVEQKFERARDAVRLVGGTSAHPDSDPALGAGGWQGLAPVAL
ncbi:hypothetical protein GCM10010517_70420 [Streptosporangium fragile]|uniref:Uncharacterized protein n=2 Tax=Streptosporangium fragile TaxID=46186 RepID=A0ABN3W889_9ACTN